MQHAPAENTVDEIFFVVGLPPHRKSIQPGLAHHTTFPSKSFLRSKLARSLRGSSQSLTKQSRDADGSADRSASADALDSEVLSTVVEEEGGEEWDDFEEITLAEVEAAALPPAAPAPPAPRAASASHARAASLPTFTAVVNKDPFATPSDYRSPASSLHPIPLPDSRTSSVHRSASLDKSFHRLRQSSRASRQSHRSSRKTPDLNLILDFPLPPSHIPTPQTPSNRPREEPTPVTDGQSVFFDRDPFRADSILSKDLADEYLSSCKVLNTPTVASSAAASFYTAQSRPSSPSPAPASLFTPEPEPEPEPKPKPNPKPKPPVPVPVPAPQSSSSARKQTPSTASHSTTLTKATASLRRFGSFTRDTLRTSFRTPIADISSPRPPLKKRAQRVSAQKSAEAPEAPAARPRLELNFIPERFDIRFPSFHGATPRISRAHNPYPLRSIQSFYGSLEEFLTSHKPQEPAVARRNRFKSAPSLLVTPVATTPRRTLPRRRIRAANPTHPTPSSNPPTSSTSPRAFPPSAGSATLHKIQVYPRISSAAASFVPPSPSWLSRNVVELEKSLARTNASVSKLNLSQESLFTENSFSSDQVEASDLGEDFTVSPFTENPPSPPPFTIIPLTPTTPSTDTIYAPETVPIYDSTSTRTNSSSAPSRAPSQATLVTRPPLRSYSSSKSSSSHKPSSVATKATASRAHSRSRNNSVTRATITHYRRSVIDNRKKNRTESPGSDQSYPRLFPNSYSESFSKSSPTVSLLPPLDIVSIGE
ncbi:hypothetical protein OF83DRAFT_1167821 [Amylostereum chailletii]|nr:hypothetical protein OF83DRAFT_1167821 [Amylostereum chailletii]